MTDSTTNSEIKNMSFEQAMSELDQVVAKLESGNAPLEQSIELYTRGTQLKARCELLLKDAQTKIEKITLDEQKKPTGSVPFDSEG